MVDSFSSETFRKFAATYGFYLIFSSPHYPQANGAAESAVKISKRILKQDDVFLALNAYRSTPIQATRASPAQLLIGRRMRTTTHMLPEKLMPEWPEFQKVQKKDCEYKQKICHNFNVFHSVKSLPPISVGDQVHWKLWTDTGTVRKAEPDRRSDIVETNHGYFRRNRKHILSNARNSPENVYLQAGSMSDPDATLLPNAEISPSSEPVQSRESFPMISDGNPLTTIRTRNGRVVQRPKKLNDFEC